MMDGTGSLFLKPIYKLSFFRCVAIERMEEELARERTRVAQLQNHVKRLKEQNATIVSPRHVPPAASSALPALFRHRKV